jgi:hypothetical protein
MHHLRFRLVCLALVLLGLSSSVMAQNREDDIPYLPFAVTGGRPDNFNYTVRDRIEDYGRLYAAINTAVPVINQITGDTWGEQIVIIMMGSAGNGQTAIGRYMDPYSAYVTRRETRRLMDEQVCHLRIFDGWATDTRLETIITRELFHCWQMAAGSAGFANFADRKAFFWLYGVAEWVAYRAFPSQFPQPIHLLFSPRTDVTQSRLEVIYFWEFMASSNGLGDTERVIAQMDALSQSEEEFPLVFNYEPTDLFHNWALMLYNRTLPLPPPVDLSGGQLPAGNSGNLSTSIERFSADFKNLFGFQVEDGNIGYITVSGLEDGNYAVSLQVSSGVQRLSDDDPFEFCPADSGNMIIVSRAGGEVGSTPMLSIEWGQNPSANACKPKPEEPSGSEGGSANCLVGIWVVDEYPVTQMNVFATIDTGDFIYEFAADGGLSAVYGITANSGPVTIHADVSYTGTYDVEATEGGNYLVNDFTLTILPGGIYTTTSNGVTTDLSKPYYETSSNFSPWSPDGELECDGDVMSWDALDGSGSFTLTRLSGP